MSFNRLRTVAFAVGALTCFGIPAVNAQTELPVNTTVGIPVPPVTFFGGTQVGTTSALFTGTNVGQTITGTLFSSVFSGGTGAQGLDFYYQFTVDAPSNQGVQSLSLSSFIGATAFVGQTTQDIDGGGPFTAGGTLAQTATRNFSGSGIVFDFGGSGVQPGAVSSTLVVRTSVTEFTLGGAAALLGTTGVSANTQASGGVMAPVAVNPSVAAPEPGTLALLGLGVLGMAGTVVRRRAR